MNNFYFTAVNEIFSSVLHKLPDFYAIGFRKDDKELTKKVNDALQELIDDGEAAKISKKWFGKDLVILQDYEEK